MCFINVCSHILIPTTDFLRLMYSLKIHVIYVSDSRCLKSQDEIPSIIDLKTYLSVRKQFYFKQLTMNGTTKNSIVLFSLTSNDAMP